MNDFEYEDAAKVGAYLLLKSTQHLLQTNLIDESAEEFQNGLMAFQIIKPVQTLGFAFQGRETGGALSLEMTSKRPPTDAGQWARMRAFDDKLLAKVPEMIPRVRKVMQGTIAEHKNSIILLQLALEQSHPLIAGLLCIMGMEARFDSDGRHDFKKKLCSCLGASTLAFPDWNSPIFAQPKYTVEELAIPLYMLRNHLAHGVDLRKASIDKTTPVDLVRQVDLIPELEARPNAYLLSEAAVYILCQVLEKCI